MLRQGTSASQLFDKTLSLHIHKNKKLMNYNLRHKDSNELENDKHAWIEPGEGVVNLLAKSKTISMNS